VGGGELLESFHVTELRHRSFSSSERLVGILSSIVEPLTTLLIGRSDSVSRQATQNQIETKQYSEGFEASPVEEGEGSKRVEKKEMNR